MFWTESDLEYLRQQNLYVLPETEKNFARQHIIDAMTFAESLPRFLLSYPNLIECTLQSSIRSMHCVNYCHRF
jgi:hypothetical protein